MILVGNNNLPLVIAMVAAAQFFQKVDTYGSAND
jgi:hypothetical protein